MRAGSRRVVLIASALMVTALMFSNCGDSKGDSSEVRLGDSSAPKKGETQQQKIRRLKEALRAGRAREAANEPDPAAQSLSGLDDLVRGSGELGVAIGTPGAGAAVTGGNLATGEAWSTIKVPIAMAVLKDAGGPANLNGAARSNIERALTASDNAAAAALYQGLASSHGGVSGAAQAVEAVLRDAGDGETVVSTVGRAGFSTYGQTDWSLAAQARFMSALAGGCFSDGASRDYILDLMGRVTSDTWGLGSTGLPARWKGGWGPDPGGRYLVRQMGVLTIDGRDTVVALVARAADGTFASGQALATEAAQWVRDRRPPAPEGGC